MTEIKPLNWAPAPGIGYTVVRRGDGGMTLTFTDLSDATLAHWRAFALEHLMGADRRTRNLYDLRQVKEIPEKAIHTAIEVNSDPAARNIRVAVVVASEKVANGIRDMYYQSLPETSAAIKIFTDIDGKPAADRGCGGHDTQLGRPERPRFQLSARRCSRWPSRWNGTGRGVRHPMPESTPGSLFRALQARRVSSPIQSATTRHPREGMPALQASRRLVQSMLESRGECHIGAIFV